MTVSTRLIVAGVAVLAGTLIGFMSDRFIDEEEWWLYVVAGALGAASLTAGVLRRLDSGE